MENKRSLETIRQSILNADMPEVEKNKIMKEFLKLEKEKINIMITGATGCGKSSTINALFDMEKAKVGVGVDPETMQIEKYELGNLVLWDSPGLGDGKEADNRHAKNIINKLYERDENGNLLIDLVLVILDGSTRDLGTSYELINEVIIPNLGSNKNRILVAINQADVAMKGRYWKHEENKPEAELIKFLNDKTISVQKRIKEGTGLDVVPIYYSAGFKEEGQMQCKPYNVSKLMYYIIESIPNQKRIAVVESANKNPDMWKHDDELRDYRVDILKQFSRSITECAGIGQEILGTIGESLLGEVGKMGLGFIGNLGGGIIGAAKGVVEFGKSIIGNFFGGW